MSARVAVWSQLFFALTMNSGLFYWTHRLVHTKLFYTRVHKQHHEYNGTIGFTAEYAHPFEQIVRCACCVWLRPSSLLGVW